MSKVIVALAAVLCLLAVVPAYAATYTANFDEGKEGWSGDGENWSATGGQDGGGYYYGERNPYGPYLTPPGDCILYGNVADNFGNVPIAFSYYLKNFTGNSQGVAMYMFADADANGAWETLWRWDPEDATPPQEWTQYSFVVDPTASETPAGWTWMYGVENSWAASWKGVKYWNFWTDSGTSGNNQNGIDTVLVQSVPEPTVLALLVGGLMMILSLRRR